MTKHRNRRTKRKSQRGGEGAYPVSNNQYPNNQNDQSWYSGITGWVSGIGDKTKELLNTGNTMVGNATTALVDKTKSGLSTMADSVSSLVPGSSQETPTVTPVSTNYDPNMANQENQGVVSTGVGSTGGRRKRRARSMKGGKGGSNLAYYAAPVSGLKVAEPTTWQYYANGVNQYSVKGGSRKRRSRKSRRTRRHKKH